MELDRSLAALIEQIHGSGRRAVIEFAGAGSLALAWLHAVAGSSRTILEATDRYSSASMLDLIGELPEKFVSRETVEEMAERAFRRAMTLSDGSALAIGVACSATIATDRVKRGDHGCWVAVRDQAGSSAYGLIISKGSRDRLGEEALVSRLLIHAIAKVAAIPEIALPLLPAEHIDVVHVDQPDALAQLLAGNVQCVRIDPDGDAQANAPVHGGLLSGSFNPLHAGHEQLLQAASVALKAPVAFEISITNADKPPLSYAEIERRLIQFRGRHNVVLGREPRFVDKASVYPGAVFVLGYDTAARLLDPRFYTGEHGVTDALEVIRKHGCRFMVAGREREGVFRTLADLQIPDGFCDLFIELPATIFRSDLSSTAIRAQQPVEDA